MASADFFTPTLETLRKAFRILEAMVPPPQRVVWSDSFVFRHAERTVYQAIVQKLARILTGLHAIQTLHREGLFQEQGMIQRGVDEIGEDITFLSYSVVFKDHTERHQEYLDYFYAEEFDDPSNIVGSHKSRGMIRREHIRGYVNQKLGDNTSRANAVGKILTKAYSGFIHAASPHIMDMCGGTPPRFDIDGEFKNLRNEEHADDALNYFLRALYTMGFAAKAFGEETLFLEMQKKAKELELEMPYNK